MMGPRGHHPAYAPGTPACALYEDGGRGMPHHPLRRPHVSNQWCSSRASWGSCKITIFWKRLYLLASLKDAPGWVGRTRQTAEVGKKNLFDELNSTLNVGKT